MKYAVTVYKSLLSYCNFRYDSVVSEHINYDLLTQIHGIQTGEIPCPELLGTCLQSKTQESIPPAVEKAEAMNGECC
jgi:glutamate--cysteine ligase catalytic subunit